MNDLIMPSIEDISAVSTLGRVYGKRWPGPHQRFAVADTSGIKVLPEVDPRDDLPSVFDQLQAGTCTANATAAEMEYDAIVDGKDCGHLSRLWIYRGERKIEGTFAQGDVGAIGHDAFTVAKLGIPDESLWPYSDKLKAIQATPPKKCDPKSARAYWLTKPVAAPSQNESSVKAALSNRQTMAIGFVVYESFEGNDLATTGIMPMPDVSSEGVLGGHEVLVVGYLKDMPGYVLVRNSWGTSWGLAGYFLMPLAFLLNPQMASDFRTIVRSKA